MKIPSIQEIFFISGDYDYLMKLLVKDKEEYYSVIHEISRCFEMRATGMVAHKCFKDSPKLFID